MPSTTHRTPLPGSERTVLPGARLIGAADPHERLLVTVMLRRRPASRGLSAMIEAQSTRPPSRRQHLSRDEFATAHGADPRDIDQIEAFAQAHDLEVVEVHAAQRRVVLSGTVEAFNAAFGVSLACYEHPTGTYRGRTGPVHVPQELAPIIEGIFGLDNRPQAQPHLRVLQGPREAAPAANLAYTPLQVARLYNFPTDLDGRGQCIAIIELGGGYRSAELRAYFAQLGIATPRTSSRLVDGGHNQPTGDPNGPDGEVLLDIEVAGAVAPRAKLVVYFAPNTDQGFLDAIMTAIHDTHNRPSVVSISWGASESAWTPQAMRAMDQAFQDAAALGVTVCCAAGDDGSADGVNDGQAHVDFPASSPYVLGCGGTHLEGAGNAISHEVVWNAAGHGATGGGVSEMFALPDWQTTAHVPASVNPGGHVGRGVPDVAGDADPTTGYRVQVDGQALVIGGTSAVAPLWAGLIALINQHLGRAVGYVNPVLYGLPATDGIWHDITTGSNGAYSAGPGWDACTGLGSPDGAKLLSALSSH